MLSAVVRRDGTSLMTIFLVTLSRRNVRPLMRSPGLLVFPGETEKTSLFMGGRKKSRSIISRAPRNRSWPMLVKKPARSWLIRTRLASTGADRKMSKKAYTSPEAKWFGQATGMRWKIIRTRILSIGRKGESTNEMIGRPLWRAFFLLARM